MHSAAVMFVVRNSFLRATLQSVAHSSAANGPGAASSPRPLQPPAWLRGAFVASNLATVMCRSLVSVDYEGFVYDCDFNQMLNLPLISTDKPKPHLRDLLTLDLTAAPIAIGEHCYGCTAGQGSSCGGALN